VWGETGLYIDFRQVLLLLLSFICNTSSSDLSLCRPLVRNAVALISSLEANIRQKESGEEK